MAASTSMMEEDPPFESFSCPITGALMEDPVMTIGELGVGGLDWNAGSGWIGWVGLGSIDREALTD